MKKNKLLDKKLLSANKYPLITIILVLALIAATIIAIGYRQVFQPRASVNPSLSNVMIEDDDNLYYFNYDQEANTFQIRSGFCFANNLRSGVESYNIFASTDPEGKKKVGEYDGTLEGREKLAPFGYPAPCQRSNQVLQGDLQHWLTNKGILAKSTHEEHKDRMQEHVFEIQGQFTDDFPSPNNCILYFHYSSNMQIFRPFYAIDLCGPTSTPTPTPTITPTPTPLLQCEDIRGPFISKSACEELCFYSENVDQGNLSGTSSYRLANCLPGPDTALDSNGQPISQMGKWYCCPSANCDATCSYEGDGIIEKSIQQVCNPPLRCVPSDTMELATCQDRADCVLTNTCWCKTYETPPTLGDPDPGCYFFGKEICNDYCTTCYSDPDCKLPSAEGAYCLY